MSMTPEKLREGIFSLNTRRFGTVAEVMVKRMASLGKAKSIFHDLYDETAKRRVEVKFSTVRKKSARAITEENVLGCIEDELAENRQVNFGSWKDSEFDCNIQQVKRSEFDILYYGLFFHDAILVFRIESGEIGSEIGYSDKQHKGNEGEGQFHISEKTLPVHLKKRLVKKLSYEELLGLLSEKDPKEEEKEKDSLSKREEKRMGSKVFAVPVVSFEQGRAVSTKGYRLFGSEEAAIGWAKESNDSQGKGRASYEWAEAPREIEAREAVAEGSWVSCLSGVRA